MKIKLIFQLNQIFKKHATFLSILALLLIYFCAGYFNYGFLASDEYWDAINRYIPAQSSNLNRLVSEEDVKSPTQIIPMYMVSQVALKMGLIDPFAQYRAVILFFSLFNVLLSLIAILWLARRAVYLESKTYLNWMILLYGFHFAMPAIASRAMFETLAIPWVFIFAAATLIYDSEESRSSILVGIGGIAIAFLLRPQAGFCALALPVLAVMKRRWIDLLNISGIGLIALLLSGIPDLLLRGTWHYSLKALIFYNIEHGADYIQQPWYYFFPLIFLFMYGPWMFQKYPNIIIDKLNEGRSLILILALFLVEHMCFANKWERFLFPMFPVMLLLMIPFLEFFREGWSKHKFRITTLVLVNFLIWGLTAFSPAQKSIIDLTIYLGRHPEIKTIYNVDGAISWLPDVLIGRLGENLSEIDENLTLQKISQITENEVIVLREPAWKSIAERYHSKVNITRFEVNLIDSLAYKFNPSHNIRRSSLVLIGLPKNNL